MVQLVGGNKKKGRDNRNWLRVKILRGMEV